MAKVRFTGRFPRLPTIKQSPPALWAAGHSTTESSDRTNAEDALRADLRSEYEALIKIVSEFDGRLMLVKGWSVTLSLTGLGLAFSEKQYALFALSSVSAIAFWSLDWVTKQHQMRYYRRMREIEVAAYHLNRLRLGGRMVSSPKVDWTWGFPWKGTSKFSDKPVQRDAANVRRLLRRAPWAGDVLLPHMVAIIVGFLLFVLALIEVPALAYLQP
ncbi:UNVERIFIED_ORG: hypothetical protein J2X79_004256 [Arthrobacter globiformis]|nr:hypothetical protein [Arthrobacter globiformis]